MMAAIAATRCQGPVTITGAECVNKSYPRFLGRLRGPGRSDRPDVGGAGGHGAVFTRMV